MARVRSPAPTRADVVMARLREDILNGSFEPGSRLGFADLGERYAVSTGVLREVLPRLVEQGLAESAPQLGFRVIEVSVERMLLLTNARIAIETLVTREAIRNGDIAWESNVVARHHALDRVGDSTFVDGISQPWLIAHEAFHIAVLEGCGNPYLVTAAVRLRSIYEVYRCWSRPEHVRTHRDVADEHRRMMDSVIAREVEVATQLTETHIRRTAELLIAGLEIEPART